MSDQNHNEQNSNHRHIIGTLFGQNLVHELMNAPQPENMQLSPSINRQIHQGFSQLNENSFDQNPIHNINSNNFHHLPQSYRLCMNPEVQGYESRSKMRHIDEMNKSVKEIMRCNQEYRGQLLSAYQNKTKIQLENAILLKEKNNLEEQKETIYAEMDEYRKKVIILEKSIQRIKENHKKTNDKLKEEIEQLHKQLNIFRNAQYDLQNKSNQNRIFAQQLQANQTKIKDLQKQIQQISHQNMQLNNDHSILSQKYQNCNNEKVNFQFLIADQKKKIQKLQSQIKQSQYQVQNVSKHSKNIQWRYENLNRQNQYERKRAESLLAKLQNLQRDNQELSNDIAYSQQDYHQLMQGYLSIKSQNDVLKALAFELETAVKLNQAYTQQINIQQNEIRELKALNAKQGQEIYQISSQHARLVHQFDVFKEAASIASQNCVQGFQDQINSIHFNYQTEVRELTNSVARLQQQNDRLTTTVFKKQELIAAKQKEISRHLEIILQLETKVQRVQKENDDRGKQIKASLLKIHQLQSDKDKNIEFIGSFQQSIKQLKGQILQNIKKQIIKIAEKDKIIDSLQNDLTTTHQQNQKNLEKVSQQQRLKDSQTQQKFGLLHHQLQTFKQQLSALQSKQLAQTQTVQNITKQLEQKNAKIMVQEKQNIDLSSENTKLKAIVQDLKAQIVVVESQYDKIEKKLKQQGTLRDEFTERLQQQQKAKQKLIKINEKYLYEIQELKVRAAFMQSTRTNSKRQYESQIAKLSEQLAFFRADHQKFKIANDCLQAIYKQIHNIEDLQRFLMTDPKINISRFTNHITALHRQAFTRQTEKFRVYSGNMLHLGQQIKGIIEVLKLNVNTMHKGFQITFAQKRVSSPEKF